MYPTQEKYDESVGLRLSSLQRASFGRVFSVKIKDYRRAAMRFEKLARRFLAMVHLAPCLVWLA